MAIFTPGVDTAVRADEPSLEVRIGRDNPLPVGRHQFQLIVTDDAGNESEPVSIFIIVRDTERPTAIIDFIDARGNRVREREVLVPFGSAFQLSGEASSDIGGQVRIWNWSLVRT
jgi:hypothetical protein